MAATATNGRWVGAGRQGELRSGRSGCGGALGHRRALDEGCERGRRRGLGRGGKEEDLVAYSWIRVPNELGWRDVSKSKPRPDLLVL